MRKTNSGKNEKSKLASPSAAAKLSASAKPNGTAKPNVAEKSKPIRPATKKIVKSKAAQEKPPAKEKTVPVVKDKIKKAKLVRDSFTMPEAEYAVLGEVKKLCLKAGIEVKKSELLRIGVAHIRQLSLLDLKKSLATLAPLKAGRPKKEK